LAVDKFFKSLERRTERDLYRKAFRATMKSQASVLNVVSGGVKKERRRKIAVEVLWIFISIFIGFVTGYTVFELILSFSAAKTQLLLSYLNFSKTELIYLLSIFSFIGVYLARLTIWILKTISN
jgi:hypothetical protein